MTPANIMLAIDLMISLSKRFIAYRDAIDSARAQNRDLTDSELDALADATDQTIELNRKRLQAMQKP